MQKVIKTVYKEVSISLEKPVEVIKSVGDKVFESLLKNFKKPPSLILKIRGLGYFYMRKNKLENTLSGLEKTFNRIKEGNHLVYETPEFIEERRKLQSLLQERQTEYFKFLDKKKLIKELRKNKPNDNS